MRVMLALEGALAAAAVVLVACGTTASPAVSAVRTIRPQPTASPTPTATASPAATPSPPSASASWSELGSIEVGRMGSVDGVIAFDAGYVAWGTHVEAEADQVVATWYSPDGVSWSMTEHSMAVSPCPGWSLRPNLEAAYDAATDGARVVLVASILDAPERPSCDAQLLVSLGTSDGTTWTRSEPFGSGWVESVWFSDGRFEARANDGTIWQSADALAWTPVMQDGYPDEVVFRVGGATDTDTRVAIQGAAEDGQAVLVSRGSESWTEAFRLPPRVGAVIVPPLRDGTPWMVAGNVYSVDSEERAVVVLTTDLVDWTTVRFPRTGIRSVVATPAGWVAIGFNLAASNVIGCLDQCPDIDAAWYHSVNGRDWSQISAPGVAVGSAVAASARTGDGPDLLAVVGQASGTQSVWGLDLP